MPLILAIGPVIAGASAVLAGAALPSFAPEVAEALAPDSGEFAVPVGASVLLPQAANAATISPMSPIRVIFRNINALRTT